ncbi:MAG: hypothetical protein Q9219_006205 [cf. Caloplaca sp. 3 TL-2023]
MAKTRSSSGITTQRIPYIPTPAPLQTATKKKGAATKKATTTKANTSKPRAKKPSASSTGTKDKPTTGRVSKARAAAAATSPKKKQAATTKKGGPKTSNKRDPTLLDKVQGVTQQITGIVQGKPGKKVQPFPCSAAATSITPFHLPKKPRILTIEVYIGFADAGVSGFSHRQPVRRRSRAPTARG